MGDEYFQLSCYIYRMNHEHIISGEPTQPFMPPMGENSDMSEEEAPILNELREYAEADREFSDAERSVFAKHFLDALHTAPGTYYENVGDLYHAASGPLVVRREDPIKALELLLEHKPIDVFYRKQFGSESKAEDGTYYNAATWNGVGSKVGLENAFIEGFSHLGGIVTVLGFEPDNLTFHDTGHSEDIRRLSSLNFNNNVSIEGEIEHEQLRFAVVRIPARFISDDQLTEDERDRKDDGKLNFVFRGVSLVKKPIN